MKKVIVMVRVSTESQELEEQKKEMIDFCKNEGYDEMVFVEDKGASAIKQNAKYLKMIEEVKTAIENDSTISCFACWALNRVARNDAVFADIKNFLIENNVQMLIKNPYLKLLNDDGTVNNGMELAASMLSILAKQEMAEKQERFKRTKRANTKKGKFNGGTIHYGYKLDAQNFLVPDEIEANVVRLMFDLYSSGKYTSYDVAKELNERGFSRRRRTNWSFESVSYLLNDSTFAGLKENANYPPIISKELFEKVQEMLAKNKIATRHGEKNSVVLSNLIKCPNCGSNFVSKGYSYICGKHDDKRDSDYCDLILNIKQEVADTAVWNVVKLKYMAYRVNQSVKDQKRVTEEINILDAKIEKLKKDFDGFADKRHKIGAAYLDDFITLEERNSRIKKLGLKVKEATEEIANLESKKEGLKNILNAPTDIRFAKNLMENTYYVENREEITTVIHNLVSSINISRVTHEGKKAVEFKINYFDGDFNLVRVIGQAKKASGKFLRWSNKENTWLSMVNVFEVKK